MEARKYVFYMCCVMVTFIISADIYLREKINIKYFRTCAVEQSSLRWFVPYEDRLAEVNQSQTILQSVRPGGWYDPPDWEPCARNASLAVLVPYRDREKNLNIFLPHMHSFLQKQSISYAIFVIEQAIPSEFNRGLLCNAGFDLISRRYNFTCFVFHDVDLLPENEFNLYMCPKSVRHMAVTVPKYSHKLPYSTYFGGVSSFNRDQYRAVNGFSNLYFGWGNEDDDLRKRSQLFASCTKRIQSDGLSSLKYDLISYEKRSLYTWALISVNETEYMEGCVRGMLESIVSNLKRNMGLMNFGDLREMSEKIGNDRKMCTCMPLRKTSDAFL